MSDSDNVKFDNEIHPLTIPGFIFLHSCYEECVRMNGHAPRDMFCVSMAKAVSANAAEYLLHDFNKSGATLEPESIAYVLNNIEENYKLFTPEAITHRSSRGRRLVESSRHSETEVLPET